MDFAADGLYVGSRIELMDLGSFAGLLSEIWDLVQRRVPYPMVGAWGCTLQSRTLRCGIVAC